MEELDYNEDWSEPLPKSVLKNSLVNEDHHSNKQFYHFQSCHRLFWSVADIVSPKPIGKA